MFSLIQKVLIKALSLDDAYSRIEALEVKIERLEGFADENESLWQFLDEQEEVDCHEVFSLLSTTQSDTSENLMLFGNNPYICTVSAEHSWCSTYFNLTRMDAFERDKPKDSFWMKSFLWLAYARMSMEASPGG